MIIPRSYEELLNQSLEYEDCKISAPETLLQNFGIKSVALHAQAPISFIVDYFQKKYLYLDPACEVLLGYSAETIIEEGPSFVAQLWHESDFKTFNEQIFPKIIGFLKGQSSESIQDYSFTFNFRITTRDKKVISVLQRSTFYLSSDTNSILAAIGFLIDISNFKEDTKIIFTIEKLDKSYNPSSIPPIYKCVFYPDKTYDVLSRREVEVLQCIHEGLSSKQIADKLFVSLNTINNHRKNMLVKTKSSNTAELLNYSIKHGVI